MKNEKDIYDILSPKFEEREVPFKMEDWKSMRTMIDESRAAKKRSVWLMASLGLLLCAGLAGAFYKWNNEGGKSNTVLAVSSANSLQKQAIINSKQNPNLTTPVNASNSKIASSNNNLNVQGSENIIKKQSLANTSLHKKNVERIRHIAKSGNQTFASSNAISSGNDEQNNSTQGTKQNNLLADKQVSVNPVAISEKQSSTSNSSITKATTVSVAKTIAHKTDSAIAGDVLPQRFSDEPRIFRGKTDIFSAEAGTEYSGGWQIGSVVQGKGFNPIIGVGYARYMGSKIFLKTGLQFSTFGNMSNLTYNYQHSAGNVIYDSVITTKRLYFLRIPVQVEYSIGRNKKSSIGIGGSAWFLLGNSGFATTYQQIDNNPPVNVEQYSQNTPLSGYTKVNASVYGLYRYNFTHNFSMYGIFYFEMTSMKNNSFFGENIIERTRGFQVTASYSFN